MGWSKRAGRELQGLSAAVGWRFIADLQVLEGGATRARRGDTRGLRAVRAPLFGAAFGAQSAHGMADYKRVAFWDREGVDKRGHGPKRRPASKSLLNNSPSAVLDLGRNEPDLGPSFTF